MGVFFTIYLGVPQVRYFARAWGVLFGRHSRSDAEGDTSHFQALSTALSGTVGTGNLGGRGARHLSRRPGGALLDVGDPRSSA